MDPRIIDATIRAADQFNLPHHHALAFVEVESNGDPFDPVAGQDKALIRWEGHYFHRRLRKRSAEALQAAVDLKLAHPSAGGIKNSRSQERRYEVLQAAVNLCEEFGLDRDLAYECISIGLGQVMGSHWEDLGYESAEKMLAEAHDEDLETDEEDQVEMIFLYLRENHLDDDVRRGDWKAAAHGYNGPAYAKNNYDVKLAQSAAKWKRQLASGDTSDYPVLRIGRRVPWATKELQGRLHDLGYHVGSVDGGFGRLTRDAVLAFQADNGLKVDGVVGDVTWSALNAAPQKRGVSTERATTTADDLRASGSKTIDLGDKMRAVGVAIGVGGGGSALVDQAESQVEEASRIVEVASDARQLLESNWELLFMAMGALVLYLGWQVVSNRVNDHRSGKHIGRA